MAAQKPYIFEMPLKVRDYEVDSQGIVNNANYLHYLEHTRHEFCESRGLSFSAMQQEGIDPVVSKIEIEYRSPLHLGETMISKLRLERKGVRFLFYQDVFTPAGALAASAVVSIVTLEDGKLSRGERLAKAFGL